MSLSPRHTEAMVRIRRDLHQHPELSWDERRTHDVVCAELSRLGIPFRAGVAGGTGVIGEIPGPPGVPAVALRADTDALPIHEETGLPFASVHDGVMHACGHDGHTAMLLGAARMLVEEGRLPAPVRLLFQPAEERGRGAEAMVSSGALDGVGLVFGGHVDRHYPAGTLAISEGAVNASSDRFALCISGGEPGSRRGREAIDAVVVASLVVMALQTLVSREVAPDRPSVVSVGRIRAGSTGGSLAAHAELEGTVRAQDPETRAHLLDGIERVALGVAALHGARIDVTIDPGTPPVLNDEPGVGLARVAAELVGAAIVPLKTANMGGEDFAFYLERVPGAYIRIGAQVPGREGYPAHSSRFDIDEAALPVGAAWFAAVAREAAAALAEGDLS